MEMEQEIISKRKPDCKLGSSTHHFSLRDLVNNPNALFGIALYPNQILAVANTVVAAAANSNLDCYSILRTRPGPELISRLKTLMLILDPDKNKLVFSEEAFKVVCDAWSVLSDLEMKTRDDNETSFVENEQNKKEEEEPVSAFTENEQKKTHVDEKERQDSGENTKKDKKETFWTLCPYCYYMYEYEKWYEECCLRCQNCRKAFHGVAVPEPKKEILVQGGDEYFCELGFFPLQYSRDGSDDHGGGMCNSYSADSVIEISDSDDDDGDAIMNNVSMKVDVRVNKAKEEVVKENSISSEKRCLGVMQGSGKTEEINGGKRKGQVKSVAIKSKVRGRCVKNRRTESMNELGAKGLNLNVKSGEGFIGDAQEMEIGSGSASASGTRDGCFDSDLEFFEKDGDVFVGIKYDG